MQLRAGSFAQSRENVFGSHQAQRAATGCDAGTRMARIYVGGGRNLGIQPENLVGAVTAEGIKRSLIGTVEFPIGTSLLKCPNRYSDSALQSMRKQPDSKKKIIVGGLWKD